MECPQPINWGHFDSGLLSPCDFYSPALPVDVADSGQPLTDFQQPDSFWQVLGFPPIPFQHQDTPPLAKSTAMFSYPVWITPPQVHSPVYPVSDPSRTPLWPPPPPPMLPVTPVMTPMIPVFFTTPVIPTPYLPQAPLASYPSPVWEAGTYPPLPLGSTVPIRLHPQLVLNPIDIHQPVLQWDIIHASDQARAVSGRRILMPAPLDAHAVTPTTDKICITAAPETPALGAWMQLWGSITIEKQAGITVRDVLDAVYEYFKTPISNKDLETIWKGQLSNESMMRKAQAHRFRDSFDYLPGVSSQHFVRSDVLGPFRRFQGLRVQIFADMSWKLYLYLTSSPLPRTVPL